MDDNKRLSDRESCGFKKGSSELEERFRHSQQDISFIVGWCLIDRFKKSVTLMCRPNRGQEWRPHDNLSDTDCLEGLVHLAIEIPHPANGKITVLQPCLYLICGRVPAAEHVRADTPLHRGPLINNAACEKQPRDLVLCTEHKPMLREAGAQPSHGRDSQEHIAKATGMDHHDRPCHSGPYNNPAGGN
jgi:hypothetical protein